MVNGRQYNRTDQTSPTQFIVPTEPWRHCHHHHYHALPPAAAAVCQGSIIHPPAVTHTSMQELVVDARAPSTKRHLHRRTLARKGQPSMPRHRQLPRRQDSHLCTPTRDSHCCQGSLVRPAAGWPSMPSIIVRSVTAATPRKARPLMPRHTAVALVCKGMAVDANAVSSAMPLQLSLLHT